LATLFVEGTTTIVEPAPSRDHTERMFRYLGVQLENHGNQIVMPGQQGNTILNKNHQAIDWHVPGDFSSASFFIVAATLIPNSEICIQNVSINPLRTGLMQALLKIGANITIENPRELCGEPVGDIVVKSAQLKGELALTESEIPSLIDEVPILTIAGLFLEGTLTVTGAEELRKKESDRIQAMADELAKCGITMDVFEDGLKIQGCPERKISLPAVPIFSHHDHRIVMAISMLNRIADPKNNWEIDGREWVNVSYPSFFEQLDQLSSKAVS
jgi:3-phosphoshikimate 1-carboxyvinyltransferase